MVSRVDARRNRERLLAAASQLFADEGSLVALDRVARAAGVGNATLYRHFPTRADLVLAVYADDVAELLRVAEQAHPDTDPVDTLFDWIGLLVDLIRDKRGLLEVAIEQRPSIASDRFPSWHDALERALDVLLARARRTDPDLGASHDDLLAIANGIAAAATDRAQAIRLLDVFRAGCHRRPSSPKQPDRPH
jgi:AcrR family transcriptional regulator